MLRHHRAILALTLTLTVGAAAPALARHELNSTPLASHMRTPAATNVCSEVCSAAGYTAPTKAIALHRSFDWSSQPASAAGHHTVTGSTGPGTTVVRVVGSNNGFDWGDAGIGAGSAVALMLLIAGAMFVVTNTRRRASSSTA